MFYKLQSGYPMDVWADLKDIYNTHKEALYYLKYWRQVNPEGKYRIIKCEVLEN